MNKCVIELKTYQRSVAFVPIISLSLFLLCTSEAGYANQSIFIKENTDKKNVESVENLTITETTLDEAAPVNENIADSVLFQAPKDKPHRFFTFTFQNDVFLNRDFGYTNGTGLSFGKGPFLSIKDNVNPVTEWLTRPLYIRRCLIKYTVLQTCFSSACRHRKTSK